MRWMKNRRYRRNFLLPAIVGMLLPSPATFQLTPRLSQDEFRKIEEVRIPDKHRLKPIEGDDVGASARSSSARSGRKRMTTF